MFEESSSELYDMTKRYAQRNYINPVIKKTETGIKTSYFIEKEAIYEISESVIESTLAYQLEKEENIDKGIPYNNIVNNIKTKEAELIDEKLERLDSLIRDCYASGVPVDAILDTATDACQLIKICRPKIRNN